jgi:hypothetical protein
MIYIAGLFTLVIGVILGLAVAWAYEVFVN